VLAASEQLPPLFERVTVTVEPEVLAERAQFANPVAVVAVGVAGIANAGLKVAVMVAPADSAPVAEVLKPTVQVAVDPAEVGDPEKVTVVGAVAAEIVTAAVGLAATVSSEVATEKVFAASEPAAGFVSPATVRVAAVLAASEQLPPLFERVTVTTDPDVLAESAQSTKPVAAVAVGVAGIAIEELNVAVMVAPADSAPVAELLKPTVHVAGPAPPVCGEPEKVTVVGAVAAEIVTADAGLTGAVSWSVLTEKVFAA